MSAPVHRNRTLWIVTGVAVLFIIASAGLALGLVSDSRSATASEQAQAAAKKAKDTADCVNRVLGQRAGPAASDAAAHVTFAKALKALTTAHAGDTAALTRFVKAANDYEATLASNEGFRRKHPLGRC